MFMVHVHEFHGIFYGFVVHEHQGKSRFYWSALYLENPWKIGQLCVIAEAWDGTRLVHIDEDGIKRSIGRWVADGLVEIGFSKYLHEITDMKST